MVRNAKFHVWCTRQHASVVIKFILGNPKDTGRLECKRILEMFGKLWKNQGEPQFLTNLKNLALIIFSYIFLLIVPISPILEG